MGLQWEARTAQLVGERQEHDAEGVAHLHVGRGVEDMCMRMSDKQLSTHSTAVLYVCSAVVLVLYLQYQYFLSPRKNILRRLTLSATS